MTTIDVKAGPDARFVTAQFHVRPDTTDEVVIDEVWGDACYRWHAALVGRYVAPDRWRAFKGPIVVDLGANIGTFSILAALSGCGQVVAFEPDPDNLTAIEANLALNGFARQDGNPFAVRWRHPTGGLVDVWPVAVGANPGVVRFEADGGGGSQVTESGSSRVDQRRLDDVIGGYGTAAVAFVKCDIEGSELEALRGGPETFGRAERLALEYHSQLGPEEWGDLVYELAMTHRLELIGRPQLGGLLYGTRL